LLRRALPGVVTLEVRALERVPKPTQLEVHLHIAAATTRISVHKVKEVEAAKRDSLPILNVLKCLPVFRTSPVRPEVGPPHTI
jgi:hypothetical protein